MWPCEKCGEPVLNCVCPDMPPEPSLKEICFSYLNRVCETALRWLRIFVPVILLLIAFDVKAQHDHHAGHSEYKNWASERTSNCCDDRDCGVYKDEDIRDTPNGKEIWIDTTWCPITKQYYLIRGKSPNWENYHACVIPYPMDNPCDRLLCFSDKGGF